MKRPIYLLLFLFIPLTFCKNVRQNDDDLLSILIKNEEDQTLNKKCGLQVWHPKKDYPKTGTKVYYQGKEYQSRFYIHAGTEPNNIDHAPWQLIDFCDAKPLNCSSYKNWDKKKTYKKAGIHVIYKGAVYQSRWYISTEKPTERNAWKYLGPCN